MFNRYSNDRKQSDEEIKGDSKNCQDLEDTITRCLNAEVKDEWNKEKTRNFAR